MIPNFFKSRVTTNLFVFIIFHIVVTEWLKEQSPLTEEELQTLSISMEDFKVLQIILDIMSCVKCSPTGVNHKLLFVDRT